MATTAWNYLQKLGGGCCNKCNEICGFGIKLRGTNRYLTNKGNWYRFESTSNPTGTRIFKLSQNVDCTWSIIDSNGRYVSVVSNFGGIWTHLLGSKSNRGVHERWYIERQFNYHYIQSASWQYYYITHYAGFQARKTMHSARRLELEYYSCDKKARWNY